MLGSKRFASGVSLRRYHVRYAAFALFAGSSLLAGCGGGSGNSASNSSSTTPITATPSPVSPGVSSSSRLLFATSIKPMPGVDTLLPDGSGLSMLTDNSTFPQHPRFNYSRSKVVYVAGSGVTHIIVANADGSAPVSLPNPPGTVNLAFPQFRPDGKALVFVADANVYTMNMDGSNPRLLTANQTTASSWPTYTPDGAKIVFQRETELGNVGINQNIAVMNADGSGETALTSDASSTQPAVSPNGQKIAFHYSNAGHDEIRAMNLDGTGVVAVVNNKESVSAPVFSPDGKQIGYLSASNSSNIANAIPSPYVVNVDGSNPRRVSDIQIDGGTLDWR